MNLNENGKGDVRESEESEEKREMQLNCNNRKSTDISAYGNSSVWAKVRRRQDLRIPDLVNPWTKANNLCCKPHGAKKGTHTP